MTFSRAKPLQNETSCISSALSIVSKKSYLHSRKTPLVWVTITFLNLEFPCLYFGNLESGLFQLRWKENCSPSKNEHKIKNKSLISHTVAMGKITQPNHWELITGKNYNYIPMMLHQKCHQVFGSSLGLTTYHIFH